MAEPKCPDCSVQGIDYIVTVGSKQEFPDEKPYFNVAHCNNCGHVYGVFAKHVFSYSSNPQPPSRLFDFPR